MARLRCISITYHAEDVERLSLTDTVQVRVLMVGGAGRQSDFCLFLLVLLSSRAGLNTLEGGRCRRRVQGS